MCAWFYSGTVYSAASLRNPLTTVVPSDIAGLRNGAMAYAPSTTTHSGSPGATSGGLEARLDKTVVWAVEFLAGEATPLQPQMTLRRPLGTAASRHYAAPQGP